ncbi:hypothetical protein BU23DRAFT_560167 [Bimuria novae-zelandiae CBS 107.79]|uniref:SAC3/GANP/THP3 conserved domain-containing protein n=1 Tax=Bimuria novae-zelandiae CBS 107.79 TaxID=1447943 RepID=A0A6A5UP23_9PLEO|nr:hypothetical protein BU23DRAFT_560167 [Bimuria novae-zelandiae CBS 107.79]
MTGGRGRGRGGGGFRGANRGRGALNTPNTSNRANGLDALAGGTLARRGNGRGNSSATGSRGRGGGFGAGGAKNEQTPEPDAADGYTGIPYDPKFAEQRKGKLNTTPYKYYEYAERFAYLKHAQQYKKKEQIAAGQLDPDGRMNLNQSVAKYGLCTDLCPELERVRRIVQKDVAGPEFTKETARGPRSERQPDERRMVAAFHRSSAGDELTLMTDLRTPKALLNAMRIMVNRLKEDEFEYLQSWIWDRSRAVRVDLNKNYRRPEDTEAYMTCYELCMRFHLLSMHIMAKAKANGKEYESKLDWEQLAATCKQITQLWDELKVYVPADKKTPSPLQASRVAEIHAYNIILGMREPEHRQEVRCDPRVRVAQQLVRAAEDTKNSATFWRIVRSSQVSYLMACAAATRFNAVRAETLEAMVKACMVQKQKVDEFTLEKLVDILGLDDAKQVQGFCVLYGGEFETDSDGVTRLRPETLTMRQKPVGLDRYFSQKYVEAKRGGRNLAAVLSGYTIQKARSEGLIQPMSQHEEDSLFIPDSSAPPKNPFAAAAGRAPSTIQPGLFDASKDPIKFATQPKGVPSSTSAPANPFASAAAKFGTNGQPTPTPHPFGAPPANNPFASPAITSAGTPTFANAFGTPGTTNAFGTSATANAFATPTITNAFANPATTNTFANPASSSAFANPATSNAFATPATTSPFGTTAGPSLFKTTTAPSTGSTGFSFATPTDGSSATAPSAPSTGLTGFTGFAGLGTSAQPSTLPEATVFSKPLQTSVTSPTENEKRQEVEEQRRKAEEAQRNAREEEERKAQAERQRIVDQQRRKAEEEQRRKALEEQAKARAAEQKRRIREEKEAERLRAERASAHKAEVVRRQALESIGTDLFSDPVEGLMKQYIQNLVATTVEESKKALRDERQAQHEALADEMWQRKQANLARAAIAKWVQVIANKRRKEEARRGRERRRKFKAELEERRSSKANSVASSTAPEGQPAAEATMDRPIPGQTNGLTNGASKPSRIPKSAPTSERNGEDSTQQNGDFSKSYYEARAQAKAYNEMQPIVDRTETNYFKMLAMGIDQNTASNLSPDSNMARKRSFDSADEDDARKRARRSNSSAHQSSSLKRSVDSVHEEDARKRARRSISSAHHSSSGYGQSLPAPARSTPGHGQSLPPLTTDEERIARFRAVKESLAKSGHGISQSFDGTRSFNGGTGRFGAAASSRQSTSDRTGTPNSENRHPYWGRTSRFVPQHLYGQPEAILSYRKELAKQSQAPNQTSPQVQPKKVPNPPNFLSSPIPTQQSYHPSTQTQQSLTAEAALVVEGDVEDAVVDDGPPEEWDGFEDEELGEEGEEFSSEEEYSEEEEQDEEEQCAQKPGGTEDDAIELSD